MPITRSAAIKAKRVTEKAINVEPTKSSVTLKSSQTSKQSSYNLTGKRGKQRSPSPVRNRKRRMSPVNRAASYINTFKTLNTQSKQSHVITNRSPSRNKRAISKAKSRSRSRKALPNKKANKNVKSVSDSRSKQQRPSRTPRSTSLRRQIFKRKLSPASTTGSVISGRKKSPKRSPARRNLKSRSTSPRSYRISSTIIRQRQRSWAIRFTVMVSAFLLILLMIAFHICCNKSETSRKYWAMFNKRLRRPYF